MPEILNQVILPILYFCGDLTIDNMLDCKQQRKQGIYLHSNCLDNTHRKQKVVGDADISNKDSGSSFYQMQVVRTLPVDPVNFLITSPSSINCWCGGEEVAVYPTKLPLFFRSSAAAASEEEKVAGDAEISNKGSG
ncbi:hypothetical protein POM88_032982 [Heracleum sosnowskyi]|uniref:Uncharacterized protein n=1 Tax=Heracleum sosnowskyi TaxID=360622 RepID=A0AAD8MLE9_9APIA|nr:hypothetical protein POM88_032982 [Heracleum sosnowskyi]